LDDSKSAATKSITELANPVEAMVNILYLIKEERHDPDKILQLASLADAPIEQISHLVRKTLSQF
jgi:hypothetical protein